MSFHYRTQPCASHIQARQCTRTASRDASARRARTARVESLEMACALTEKSLTILQDALTPKREVDNCGMHNQRCVSIYTLARFADAGPPRCATDLKDAQCVLGSRVHGEALPLLIKGNGRDGGIKRHKLLQRRGGTATAPAVSARRREHERSRRAKGRACPRVAMPPHLPQCGCFHVKYRHAAVDVADRKSWTGARERAASRRGEEAPATARQERGAAAKDALAEPVESTMA